MNEAVQTEDLAVETPPPVDETGVNPSEDGANVGTEEGHEGDEHSGQGQSKTQNAKQRLRRKLREEESRRAQLEETNRKLEEKFSSLESRLKEIENPLPERPQRVDFDSEEQYEDALYGWRQESETRRQSTQRQPEPVEQQAGGEQQQQHQPLPPGVTQEGFDGWLDQLDDAREKFTDFDQVAFKQPSDGGPAITDVMAQTIMLDPHGAEISYHLGKNPNEAQRIAQMPFASQVTEIQKLAGNFNNSTTSAPEPIDPVGGTDGFAGKDPNKMTPEEYRDWRRTGGR